VSDEERRALIDELEGRVARRQEAGDYDLPWLEARVEEVLPPTPVDRYLQTARGGRGRAALVRGRRLREALAWLGLALQAESRAREELDDRLDEVTTDLGMRLERVERDLRALGHAHGERIHRLEDDRRWIAGQALRGLYPELAAPGAGPLDLESFEARVSSQNGEDGILLRLFSLIGATNRRFVEIGIEDGRECNTANLALGFGWSGLMIDRDADGVDAARRRYAARPQTAESVRVLQRHVTRESIDELLASEGFAGEPDLLSIDIDGNDLWVWEAVERSRPRVVVVEYNASFGPERSVSVPYDPDFDRMTHHPSGYYHGASITALARVGGRKGYVLAGCDGNGVNAFFVRSDCAEGVVAAVAPPTAWRPIRERGPQDTAEQFALIAHLPIDEVP
jgi:hypothetical protein